MNDVSFLMSPENAKASRAEGRPLACGLQMHNQEGIWVNWLSNPEKIQKILPPPLKLLAPMVSAYIINIKDPIFAPSYMEACIMVPVLYNDLPGAYLFSLLLEGPGEQMGSYLGREIYGLPKKIADKISVVRKGDSISAYVERRGIRILDVEVEIGEYNTPNAEQIFADRKPGAVSEGRCYFHKFNMDQDETGKINFSQARLVQNNMKSSYKEWLPSTAKVTLLPSVNDPWAELEVVQVLGAGYYKNDVDMDSTTELEKLNTDEVMPYLMAARYDSEII